MSRSHAFPLLACLLLAALGCPGSGGGTDGAMTPADASDSASNMPDGSFMYPASAIGRYCRHRTETCRDMVGGTIVTAADCIQLANASRAQMPAACQSLYDTELDCASRAACTVDNACPMEHDATNACIASGGMGADN